MVNGEYAGGRSNFGRYLSSVSVDEGFIQNIKAVLVVSDNDDELEASFAEVQEQIKAANLPVPAAVDTPAKQHGKPTTVILMLPIGTPGNLKISLLAGCIFKMAD